MLSDEVSLEKWNVELVFIGGAQTFHIYQSRLSQKKHQIPQPFSSATCQLTHLPLPLPPMTFQPLSRASSRRSRKSRSKTKSPPLTPGGSDRISTGAELDRKDRNSLIIDQVLIVPTSTSTAHS